MTLFELVGLLRRQWPLVLAGAVLGMLVALGIGFLLPASYTATTRVYVSSTGPTAELRLQNSEYARTRVSSYAQLVESPVVVDTVREDLKIPPKAHFVDSIRASNPLDSLILDIEVTDSSPERAQRVAGGIGEVFNSVVADLEAPGDSAGSPVRVSVFRPPELPTHPDGPSTKLLLAAGVLLGLVVGLAAARAQGSWRQRPPTGSPARWTPGAHPDPEGAHQPGMNGEGPRPRDEVHP